MQDNIKELQQELERLKQAYETERDPFERAGMDVRIQDLQAELLKLRQSAGTAGGRSPQVTPSGTDIQRLVAVLQNKEEYSDTNGVDLAGQQLVAMGAAATPALLELLRKGNETGRANAARLLGYICEPLKQVLPALERAFRADPDQEVRRIAGKALGDIGEPALPILVNALRNGDGAMCEVAAQALVDLGPKAAPAVPALIEVLRSETRLARASAADALGAIGPAAAPSVPGLIKALDDGDTLVRKRAAAAFGAFGPRSAPAIPNLIGSLRDTNPDVRAFAARSLGRIGNNSAPVLQALQEALSREQELFPREEISYALMVLEKK